MLFFNMEAATFGDFVNLCLNVCLFVSLCVCVCVIVSVYTVALLCLFERKYGGSHQFGDSVCQRVCVYVSGCLCVHA